MGNLATAEQKSQNSELPATKPEAQNIPAKPEEPKPEVKPEVKTETPDKEDQKVQQRKADQDEAMERRHRAALEMIDEAGLRDQYEDHWSHSSHNPKRVEKVETPKKEEKPEKKYESDMDELVDKVTDKLAFYIDKKFDEKEQTESERAYNARLGREQTAAQKAFTVLTGHKLVKNSSTGEFYPVPVDENPPVTKEMIMEAYRNVPVILRANELGGPIGNARLFERELRAVLHQQNGKRAEVENVVEEQKRIDKAKGASQPIPGAMSTPVDDDLAKRREAARKQLAAFGSNDLSAAEALTRKT